MLSGWPIGHERADGSGAAGAPQPRRLERAIRTRGFGARAVAPVPWLADVLRAGVPDGPVLELASGRSGTALALAAHGRQVTAIDVSDVALLQLDSEAVRRGVADRLNLVQADLGCWEPGETRFALVLSRLFWDAAIFHRACEAVMPGGVLAWGVAGSQWRRGGHSQREATCQAGRASVSASCRLHRCTRGAG